MTHFQVFVKIMKKFFGVVLIAIVLLALFMGFIWLGEHHPIWIAVIVIVLVYLIVHFRIYFDNND